MKIEIKNLSKSYKDNTIFKGFNFDINDNDFIVVYGASGVGKSTLLNMLGTMVSYDSGNIIYKHNEIDIKDQRLLKNKHITYLYQDYFLIDNKTVYQNLCLALLDKKLNKSQSRTKILDALDIVNLKEKIDEYVYTLSGGQQQRVALIRCLLRDTDVILADEPTGNLDKENKEIIINLLKLLNQRNKTIIVATHDDEFKKIANRVVYLK